MVNFRVDRDVIPVTHKKGGFRAIRIRAAGSPLEMFKVVVTFGNGEKFSPPVRHIFRQGALTRRIDLPGKKRVIRKVAFWYRSIGKRSGKAVIQLFGQH